MSKPEFYKAQWTGGLPHTVSGSGSLLENTVGVRNFLPEVISEYGIKTMFDAPCGDRYWIKTLDFDALGCDYAGGEYVQEIVDDIDLPSVRQFDVRTDEAPDVDLWFCRDLLFHFSEADIDRAMENMVDNSQIRYMLVTSHTEDAINAELNREINTGDFRVLVFSEHEYFGLGEPIAVYDDPNDSPYHKVMMLFDLDKAREE